MKLKNIIILSLFFTFSLVASEPFDYSYKLHRLDAPPPTSSSYEEWSYTYTCPCVLKPKWWQRLSRKHVISNITIVLNISVDLHNLNSYALDNIEETLGWECYLHTKRQPTSNLLGYCHNEPSEVI